MKWDSRTIYIGNSPVSAIAPTIISASRATDIPAFYSDWLAERLRIGFVKWINPFNKKPQYISFEKAKVIVFWSKNPRPLIPHLKQLDDMGITYYLQYTLNDYESEGLEPGVPPLVQRIDTFREFSEKVGNDRVIWRFDPLILTSKINTSNLLEKIQTIGDKIHTYTNKLVFSFADIGKYKAVQINLKKHDISYTEFNTHEMTDMANRISILCNEWGISAFSCGEEIDLTSFGVYRNKCIDDELILKITKNDAKLTQLLKQNNHIQLNLFGDNSKITSSKDTGQRTACGCAFSKDIGQYNTCPHLCTYCYANSSETTVKLNYVNHNKLHATIAPE